MMEIKIRIKTPKGEAKSVEWKLRPFLLGNFQKVKEFYVSPNNDEIVWIVEADVRKCMSITTRVGLFDNAVSGAFKSKPVKWAMKTSSRDSQEQVRKMIKQGTKIEIIKTATYEEWEKEKKPFWKRLFKSDEGKDDCNNEQKENSTPKD